MVNYIKHLTNAIDRIADDRRCRSLHLSLYIALFYYWNRNRFSIPMYINRYDLFNIARFGSVKRYYKCMKELDEWGYIKYNPSHSPARPSEVIMNRFDISEDLSEESTSETCEESVTDPTKESLGTHEGVPSINSINNKNILNKTNSVNDYEQADENSNLFNGRSGKTRSHQVDSGRSKKSARHKTEAEESRTKRPQPNIPESLEEAIAYFEEKKSTAAEAEKFHNYFESIGWRVGGRATMRDWRAAARNWIANISNFNNTSHGKPTKFQPQLTGKKNYAEPF